MGIKVTKFGGSSLANAEQFKKVIDILKADPQRRYAVPSAPGKRFSGDDKITDLLYKCHDIATAGKSIDQVFDIIRSRYINIAQDLGLDYSPEEELEQIRRNIQKGERRDYVASRGEYLNGLILAHALKWDFIDAADVIFFDQNGIFDSEKTNEAMAERLAKHAYAVIPGFYGRRADGGVKTFSRGGSDITGSIVARAVNAELYENWTDVSGFMVADPRIVDNPAIIRTVSYRELRELSYMGATVLHEDAIFPVSHCGIPINIKNTNHPEDKGTMIVSDNGEDVRDGVVTGIAGRKDFTVITLEKDMMNTERGFGRKVLSVFEDFAVSFEHMPTGIDTMSVVVSDKELYGKKEDILNALKAKVHPDSIVAENNLAIIAVVGRGMVRAVGTAGRVFSALSRQNINVRMIDQGSSELNIIVGVDNSNFEGAISAIYHEFFD
ncbi:MAG TPA: aspartate kinase [Firmicutes bacterium]|nr:aspartate kinase [Bacillota bacterium]